MASKRRIKFILAGLTFAGIILAASLIATAGSLQPASQGIIRDGAP